MVLNDLSKYVDLFGYQSDVIKYYAKSKIFVQSSKYEGLSLSLIESMYMDLVPILTNAGSEKDYIIDYQNGLYFEYDNSDELAEKIKYALLPKNYSRLQKNVLDTKKSFRITQNYKACDDLILKALGS